MIDNIKFPKIWLGYLFVPLFIIAEIASVIIRPDLVGAKTRSPLVGIVGLSANIYWLICIYKIHKILNKITMGKHPISAWKAVGFQFIPFYNIFYWIFKWPSEIINLVNSKANTNLSKWLPGLLLFCGMTASVAIDGSLAIIANFSVLIYLANSIKKVREH